MESDTTAIELLDRLAKTWAKWIGPSGDREQYKRMSQFAADGAAALRERDTLRAELAAARLEIEALRVKPWQEQIEGQSAVISRLRYEKGVAEAEAAELRAHVERMRKALDGPQVNNVLGLIEDCSYAFVWSAALAFMEFRTGILSATPAQSLAAVKAEALSAMAQKLTAMNDHPIVLHVARIIQEDADKLQAEAANGPK